MKAVSLFVFCFLVNLYSLCGQHCAFDHNYLIGVRPFDKDSTQIIRDLTITLVDEFQRPINLKKTSALKQNYIKKQRRLGKTVAHEDLQYWFAPNDYVGVGSFDQAESSALYIKIEDKRNLKKHQTFQTQIVPISSLNFIYLCGYDPFFENEKFKRYRPVWVDLNNPQFQDNCKIYEVQPFIFRLDENPKGIEACEAPGCYAVRLEVFSRGNQTLIHDSFYYGIRTKNDQENLFQIADFNFDGYQDFSIFDNSKRQYFLFHPKEERFKRDSLLSSFDRIEINFEKKSLLCRTIPKSIDSNGFDQQWFEYQLSGVAIGQVEINKIFRDTKTGLTTKKFVHSLMYMDGKLEARVRDNKSSIKSVSVKGFRFERELQTYHQPEDTEVKPLGWKPSLAAVAIYRIYRIADNKQIFIISGETYFNYNGGEIREPHVKDVDFDGWPELIIPYPGSMTPNRYFGYDAKNENFRELFISYLQDLQIDEKNQRATGYRFVGQASSPYPTAKIHYVLQGLGLPIVKERREELPQPERKPLPPNLVVFSKIENHYLVEVKLLDSLDFLKLGSKSEFTHKISVLNQKDKKQNASFYLKAFRQLSAQELEAGMNFAFLNFDAYPELIFAPHLFGDNKQIWLSCFDNGVLTYYFEEHLSRTLEYSIDATNQVIRGNYVQGENRIFYEFHYLYEPFAVITTQEKSNPKTATRAIYSNSCGVLTSKRASLIEPILLVE
jgi:hypothetical protein